MTIFLSMDDLRSEGSGNSVKGSHNSLLYLYLLMIHALLLFVKN